MSAFKDQLVKRLRPDEFVIASPDKTLLAEIRRGVILVHAAWSASSLACLPCWRRALDEVSLNKPWLYIIDADAVTPEWSKETFGELLSGNGEAFWVVSGTIVAREAGYGLRCDDVLSLCRRHLDEPAR